MHTYMRNTTAPRSILASCFFYLAASVSNGLITKKTPLPYKIALYRSSNFSTYHYSTQGFGWRDVLNIIAATLIRA